VKPERTDDGSKQFDGGRGNVIAEESKKVCDAIAVKQAAVTGFQARINQGQA
jgi:hypothetical protein